VTRDGLTRGAAQRERGVIAQRSARALPSLPGLQEEVVPVPQRTHELKKLAGLGLLLLPPLHR
jgi:hypothetical protein